MIRLLLDRENKLDDRTLGRLVLKDNDTELFELCTLELPWRDNERNVSCIPEGRYDVVQYSSKKFPDTFKILNVKGRSDILIHCGNYPEDTNGCILIGKGFDSKGNLRSSRSAMNTLNQLVDMEEEIEIIIS